MKLDHVALGVAAVDPVLRTLVGEMGAAPLWGGEPPGAGFRVCQLRMGRGTAGMTVELITPYGVGDDHFLVRFLAESGEGPHHLTFKVEDLESELDRLADLGFKPVNARLDNPAWREAFIHPSQSHGTVIQIAQAGFDMPPIDEMVRQALEHGPFVMEGEPWLDPEAVRVGGDPAVLQRVVIRTPDLEAAVVFYGDVLRGSAVSVDGDRVDVVWEGGVVRLERADVDRPAVDRLEVVGGDGRGRTVGGTRCVSAP